MPKRKTPRSRNAYLFGRFVRRLRNIRGETQESLAERSGLSPDTVRRMESGDFSPSLDTLTKISRGLRMDIGTLMMAFELNEVGSAPELAAVASSLSRSERLIAVRILATLADLVAPLASAAEDA